MQVIKAVDLFKDIKTITRFDFEKSKNMVIDFANIENIDLKAITTLLNLQKIAILNKKSLTIKNVNPSVGRMLDVTGLTKTFANVATNPISKRQVI